MAGRPLVSIITPTLNQAQFIGDALASIGAQSYSNVEHIVVDGGSTDGTVDMLRAAAGGRMRWSSALDAGMYDAINTGLRQADGEILGYLNSDDLYFPWTVAAAVEAFDRWPAVDVIYGDALRLDERDGTLVPWLQSEFDPAWTGAWGSLIQPAVLWRARVTADVGLFDSTLRYVGDLDYWLRASRRHVFRRIDEILALDRAHGASASIASAERMAVEDRAVRSRYSTSGPGRSPVFRALSRSRAGILRRRRWLSFVLACRGLNGGWSRSRSALRPTIDAWAATWGLVPRLSWGAQRQVRWRSEPLAVATGRAPQGRSGGPG